jgi:hypothetical protein
MQKSLSHVQECKRTQLAAAWCFSLLLALQLLRVKELIVIYSKPTIPLRFHILMHLCHFQARSIRTSFFDMGDDIQACRDLVNYNIPRGFSEQEHTYVNPPWEPIVNTSTMALYARALSGEMLVHILSTRLIIELQALAEVGPGYWKSIDGVRYEFRNGKLSPVGSKDCC